PSWNSLAWATSTEDGRPMEGRRTAIIRALLTNESYRSFFITRFCDLINSEYLPENMIRILNDLSSNIKSEISRHTEKWGRGCLESWMNELEVIKEYVSLRTENVRHHIRSQFESLDSMSTISIDSSIPNACNFELNTIVLNDTSFPWAGIYFNGLPITISVIENPGFKFIGWENTNITDASIAFNLQNDTSLVAIFESTFDPDVDIVINEISYAQSDAFDSGDWIELFNNTNEAVDLSGWILHDGSNNDPFVFPSSTVLDASDYLVIVKDEVKFESVYPNVNNLIGEIDFGLSKQGDLIELFDNDLFLIDVVDYKTESPWPSSEGANSISLMDPKLNNNIGESWISSLTLRGTPGIQNDIINDISNQTLFSQSPLTLFPNPSNNLINIVPNAKGTIYIYNQIGLLVASFNNDGSSLNLDISKYQSGNHFVVFVTSEGLRYTSVFIKE
ncbi:MAG: T9SS type A sorting domain-containing protein, partial [Saprospiraceae bacterium]|nr:T9SS type A sorting domain-containing protein [Saprospiraceae bacterium]